MKPLSPRHAIGWAFLCTGIALIPSPFPVHAAETPKQPRIVGEWWQVAGNPDLGDLTSPSTANAYIGDPV
jgi:hypothetical protein